MSLRDHRSDIPASMFAIASGAVLIWQSVLAFWIAGALLLVYVWVAAPRTRALPTWMQYGAVVVTAGALSLGIILYGRLGRVALVLAFVVIGLGDMWLLDRSILSKLSRAR
jgi:hypothetical protein